MTASSGASDSDGAMAAFASELVTPEHSAWTHENCNRSGWIGAGEPCPICERESRFAATSDVCPRCDGDGYVECWNHDQTDVVITLCTDCGPGPGWVDG